MTLENKTQRVERLKREKNAWEHLDEIREFARKGYESIPAEWLGTYFRPWGVYTQGDGAGALGGKGGEGKAVPYFMVRIRVPNGLLTSHQVRAIARRGGPLRAWRGRPHRPPKRAVALGDHRGAAGRCWRTCGARGSPPWVPAVTTPGTLPAARWLESTATRFATPHLSCWRPPGCWSGTPRFTICRANSRSALQAAASGAPIPKSTTWA